MNTLHVKKGDTVVVLSGNEKGKIGKVIEVFPQKGLVVIEGVNMRKKHQKPKREGQAGQIIDKQHPIAASKVMVESKKNDRAKKTTTKKKTSKSAK